MTIPINKYANYSILQQNVLNSLFHEESQKAFLKICDLPCNDRYSYVAEAFAREVEQLCDVLKPSIDGSASILEGQQKITVSQEVKSDLLDFVLKRHWHYRMNAFKDFLKENGITQ